MSALISNPALRSLLRGILVWAPLWMLTTVVFGILGFVYAFGVKRDVYVASQAILVRDEATGAVMRLGRFQSQAEQKAAQEIVLEMAKSHQVIKETLASIGPPPSISNWLLTKFPLLEKLQGEKESGEYPSKEEIENTAKSMIQVHAPKGVEFGVTEVIYLDTKSTSTEHAIVLNKSLCDALEARLQRLRQMRADGVLDELIFARDAARRALAACTEQLNQMEREAGADLADLRGMTDAGGGSSTKLELENLRNEIRQVELAKQSLLADREMLERASRDPKSIIVAPATYLNAHPGLKRMREGLVDAQIANATIRGRYTDEHPAAIASDSTQEAIVQRFAVELQASIASVDNDILLTERRLEHLQGLRKNTESRLNKLAEGRAHYANVIAEVRSKTALLEAAEKDLAETEAARDSAAATSLLTRIDPPIVSDRPVGPGKKTIAAMCAIAGLVFGLGIVFAITPIDFGPNYGRRADDQASGGRSADSLHESQSNVPAKEQPVAPEPKRTPRTRPPAIPALAPSKPDALSSSEVDAAFRELAKLTSRRPESREEEITLHGKIQELKSVLTAFGHKTDLETLQRYGWTKPRSARNG